MTSREWGLGALAMAVLIVASCHRARPTAEISSASLPYGFLPAWRVSREAQCDPRFRPPSDPVSRISQPVGRFELDLQHPGIISGVVTTRDNTSLADAAVELRTPHTIIGTDATGSFTLKPLPPGRYVLRTRALGYEARFDTIEVTATAGVRVRLPLDQVYHYLNDVCGMFPGVLAAPPMPTPVPITWPNPPHFVDVPCPTFTTPAQTRRHVAAPNGELRGRVGVDHSPPEGWGQAVVDFDARTPPPYIVTNDSGRFVVRDVKDGEHALRIRALGYFPLIDTVIVDPRGAAILEYELETWPLETMGQTCRQIVPARKPD